MPIEKMSRKLSAACAVILILFEINETTTLRMIRQITTASASLAAPLLVEIAIEILLNICPS
jgi:hypothetical protein